MLCHIYAILPAKVQKIINVSSLVHQQSLLPLQRGIGLFEVSLRFFDAATAAGSKRNHDLAFQLRQVVVQPRVDDTRTDAPPDRETDIDGVVRRDVRTTLDGRALVGIVHLDGRTGLVVTPIEVRSGIRLGGFNLP